MLRILRSSIKLYVILAISIPLLIIAIALGTITSTEKYSITLMIYDWPGDQIFPLIKLLDLEDEYNLDLQIIRNNNIDDHKTAWVNRQIDIEPLTLDFAFELARSDDIRIIYAYDESFGADAIISTQDIQTLSDLDGMRIGVNLGATSHLLALAALDSVGLSHQNVTFIDMEADEVIHAFTQGRVDAVVNAEPNISSIFKALPDLHILATTRDFPDLVINVVFVRASAFEANPDAYKALIHAADAVIKHCTQDFDHCLALLAEETGHPPEVWRSDFEGLRLLSIEDNQHLFDERLKERLDFIQQFLENNGVDLPPYDTDNWLTWVIGNG